MSNWTQVGASLVGEAPSNRFGDAVAMSSDGTIVAVGAPQNDGTTIGNTSDNRGSVRVFKWNGTVWNQLGADIDGAAAGDKFGSSITLSANGTIMAIGGWYNDGSTGDINDNRGHVRIYNLNAEMTAWTLEMTLVGEVADDRFGKAIALSANGQILAIGAPSNDASGNNSGRMYVYYKNNGTWAQRGSSIGGLTATSYLGTSIAISADGNIIAIGATGYNTNNGYVQVFEWDNTSNWVQKGSTIFGLNTLELRIPGPDIDHPSNLGTSVALSSNGLVLAIGAARDSTNTTFDTGRVHVYDWVSNAWTLRGSPIDGLARDDSFGYSIDLSADGNILVASSPYYDTTNTNAGQVRVFQYTNSAWTQLGSNINGEVGTNNIFGSSVAVSSNGGIFVAGAPLHGALQPGNARVFSYPLSVPCLPAGTRVLTAAGYKAVEELAQDDLIVTSEGQAVPFKVYTTDISITTEKNAAYRIPAHTFGKFPVKDLTLSPNHAFQSRPGIWQIPKYAAQQWPEIRQVGVGKPVTYYHIETPDYFKDNLIVEGTPVESFAHEQLRKGEIVYSYSARYNGFIRSQAARQSQSQARLTK